LSLAAASSQAAVISGSEGRVALNSSGPEGSFAVDVAYQLYDGTSASDPLGETSDLQLAFVLQHQGASDVSPALAFGEFDVFAPTGQTIAEFYTGIHAVAGNYSVGPAGNQLNSSGGLAPDSGGYGEAMLLDQDYAWFYYYDNMLQQQFLPNHNSQLLVLTIDPDMLQAPTDIGIEVYGTNTGDSLYADTFIALLAVPEPASAMLLLAAAAWMKKRR
jgi:hypothetical protein